MRTSKRSQAHSASWDSSKQLRKCYTLHRCRALVASAMLAVPDPAYITIQFHDQEGNVLIGMERIENDLLIGSFKKALVDQVQELGDYHASKAALMDFERERIERPTGEATNTCEF